VVAVRQDLQAEQNGTLRFEVQVLDSGGVDPRTDLIGWTGVMQIREGRDQDAALIAEATVSIDIASGIVTAVVDAADLVTEWRAGEYDLVIVNGVDREPLAWGTVRFRKTVIV
jgi:hypothetical protein